MHWAPPPAALEVAAARLAEGGARGISGYGPAEGLPALREALQHKLAAVNGLTGVRGRRGFRGWGKGPRDRRPD